MFEFKFQTYSLASFLFIYIYIYCSTSKITLCLGCSNQVKLVGLSTSYIISYLRKNTYPLTAPCFGLCPWFWHISGVYFHINRASLCVEVQFITILVKSIWTIYLLEYVVWLLTVKIFHQEMTLWCVPLFYFFHLISNFEMKIAYVYCLTLCLGESNISIWSYSKVRVKYTYPRRRDF